MNLIAALLNANNIHVGKTWLLVVFRNRYHSNLKETVVDICYKIGLEINDQDIAACHRLPKPRQSRWPPNVIVRFFNRDHVDYCLHNRDRLKIPFVRSSLDMNLRFFENLSSKNAECLRIAKWLMDEELISKYFLRNGFVKIIIEDDEDPIRIRHPDILRKKFVDTNIPV